MTAALARLLDDIRVCAVCAAHLPHGVRPVVQAAAGARLVVVGQAPGAKVHASGVPWDDASGARLRGWLGLAPAAFYDPEQVALIPMGFCYPGRRRGGDLPPGRECAPLWHRRLLAHLPDARLMVLAGAHAQAFYLGERRGQDMTGTMRAFRERAPGVFPLPHPSWRSAIWMSRNPWFETEALPALRADVREALGGRAQAACPPEQRNRTLSGPFRA